MVPYLLFYKIAQLFIIMLLGFLLVRLKIINSSDSRVLSKISLYLLMPAAIINAFNVELTQDIKNGLFWAFAAAVIIHILFLIFDRLYARVTKASVTERASVIYSNAANLIIPIVSFVLGEEWVIYSCAYMSVQIVLLWTYGISLFDKSRKADIRKIIFNVNIIAIITGALIMLLGIKLPSIVKDVTSSLGSMLGNVGMLIAGMLMAQMSFKKLLSDKLVYRAVLMRMIALPVVVLAFLKGLNMLVGEPFVRSVLLVSFLASITPSAATVMQFAQLHGGDEDAAVSINIISTAFCIITMPIFVALY